METCFSDDPKTGPGLDRGPDPDPDRAWAGPDPDPDRAWARPDLLPRGPADGLRVSGLGYQVGRVHEDVKASPLKAPPP